MPETAQDGRRNKLLQNETTVDIILIAQINKDGQIVRLRISVPKDDSVIFSPLIRVKSAWFTTGGVSISKQTTEILLTPITKPNKSIRNNSNIITATML